MIIDNLTLYVLNFESLLDLSKHKIYKLPHIIAART